MSEKLGGIKYNKSVNKLPWSLLPFEATEGMLKVLVYGRRKYTVCRHCKTTNPETKLEEPTRIYPNPRLDGDPPRSNCPSCGSTDIETGAHNWRKGFLWTELLDAAFRHLKAIQVGQDLDPESGLPHADHALCMVSFLSEHQKMNYGKDDRYKVL